MSRTRPPTGRRHHRATQIRVNAAEDLRFIREAMEHSSRFTDVPGRGMVLIGCTGLLTALLARMPESDRAWLALWVADGFIAFALGLAAIALKARARGATPFALPTRKFFLGLLPGFVAAAVLTGALAEAGRYDLIPGMWLLMYGAAVLSAGAHSISVIPVMGACFMVLGLAAIGLPALDAKDGLADVCLATGFGGLHIGFGVVIARRFGG